MQTTILFFYEYRNVIISVAFLLLLLRLVDILKLAMCVLTFLGNAYEMCVNIRHLMVHFWRVFVVIPFEFSAVRLYEYMGKLKGEKDSERRMSFAMSIAGHGPRFWYALLVHFVARVILPKRGTKEFDDELRREMAWRFRKQQP